MTDQSEAERHSGCQTKTERDTPKRDRQRDMPAAKTRVDSKIKSTFSSQYAHLPICVVPGFSRSHWTLPNRGGEVLSDQCCVFSILLSALCWHNTGYLAFSSPNLFPHSPVTQDLLSILSRHVNLVAWSCSFIVNSSAWSSVPSYMMQLSFFFTHFSQILLTTTVLCLLTFPLGSLQGWIRFYDQLLVLLDGYLSYPLYLHTCDVLRQLPLSKQILYHFNALVSCCTHLFCAPSYLCHPRCPVSDVAVCQVLHSAIRGELLIPRAHVAIVQRRVFWLWARQSRVTSHLSCALCQWGYTRQSLQVSQNFFQTWLGALLSNFLKRCYISSQNEWKYLSDFK